MSGPKTTATWFFVGALALSIAVVWELAVPLSAGAVIAFVSERPIERVAVRLKKQDSRAWRWILAVGFVFAAALVVLVPLGIALYVAARDLARVVTSRDSEQWSRVIDHVLEWSSARLGAYGVEIAPGELSLRARMFIAENAAGLGSYVGTALSATPNAIFHALVALLAWIFLAVEGPAARERVLVRLIPWPRERETIRAITAEVIHSTIVANVIVSFAQALLLTLVLLIFRVPRAFVWGVLTFFLSFVPVIGTAPVTLGAAAYLLSQGRSVAAVVMLVIAFLVASLDNFLRPFFMRSSVDLNFLWILVALIGGVALFGLPGVILGPLAFSMLIASLRTLEALDVDASDV
jgi:predicted PurR-regulated permease PerM